MSQPSYYLHAIASQLDNIKGVNTINNRRIVLIYQWRITYSDLKRIFTSTDISYHAYHNGCTYVLHDTKMTHPTIISFNHHPNVWYGPDVIVPSIRMIKDIRWKALINLCHQVNQLEAQFDMKAELAIGTSLVMMIVLWLIYQAYLLYL